MESKLKLVINNMESKYFENYSEIEKYLKENKWNSAKVYEFNGNEFTLAYFL